MFDELEDILFRIAMMIIKFVLIVSWRFVTPPLRVALTYLGRYLWHPRALIFVALAALITLTSANSVAVAVSIAGSVGVITYDGVRAVMRSYPSD